MSLHSTFNDIDSTSELIYDIISLRGTKSDLHKPFLVPLGSRSLKEGLKLQVLPQLLQENSSVVEVMVNTKLAVKAGDVIPI